ncbi:MAG: hypothetical protein HZC28_06395 [Spirochaetes bacterium]|nr:hypothetical protein [Spirochaetota bacterium]
MDDKINEIVIHFTKSKDYRMVPITGVWGGLNAAGNLVVDCYVEKKDIPESVKLQVSPGTVIEVSRSGERTIREVQVGMELRPDIAYSIGKWLIESAKKAGVKEIEPGSPN